MPRPEEIRFRAGDASLAATLTLPDTDGRAPWAVLVPSWLPRNRDGEWDRAGHRDWYARTPAHGAAGLFARLADALAERGVASLRYDPRGCAESEGKWESVDLFTRIDDARDAVGAMRSRRELDLRRTAIVGHGEGAIVAMSVAIADPAIGALGLVGAPARSFRDVLRRGAAERSRTGADRQHPVVAALDAVAEDLIERADRREPSMSLRIGRDAVELRLAAWQQAFLTPTMALATMLHRNVAMVHGSDDAWADADESRLLEAVLRKAGNDPVTHRLEAGHDLTEAADSEIGDFADSLVARMQPRELPPVLVAIEEMGHDG